MTTINNIYAQMINIELFDKDLFTDLVKKADKQVLKDLFISTGFLDKLNLTKSNENLEFIRTNLFNDMPGSYGINSFYLVNKLSQANNKPSHLKVITSILNKNWQEDLAKIDLISYRKDGATLRFNQNELTQLESKKLNVSLNRKLFHLYLMTKEDSALSKVNKNTLLNNWNNEDDALFKQIFSQKSVHALTNDKIFSQFLKEKTLEQLQDAESLFKLIDYNLSKNQVLMNFTLFFNTVGFNFKKDCNDYNKLLELLLKNNEPHAFDSLSVALELGLKIKKSDLDDEKIQQCFKMINSPSKTNKGTSIYQDLANKKNILTILTTYNNWDEKSFKKLLATFSHLIEQENINTVNDYLGKKTALTLLTDFIDTKEALFKKYPHLMTEDFKSNRDLISIVYKSNKIDSVIKLVEYGADTTKLYKDKKTQLPLIELAKTKKSKTHQNLVIALEKVQLDRLLDNTSSQGNIPKKTLKI